MKAGSCVAQCLSETLFVGFSNLRRKTLCFDSVTSPVAELQACLYLLETRPHLLRNLRTRVFAPSL